MDFRVYLIIEMPLIDRKYEVLVPIDRRVHELITALKKSIPELSQYHYSRVSPVLYNKSTGDAYDANLIIKNSNIKMGTRLLLI